MGKKVYRGGWTPERDDELRVMWADGILIHVIAAHLGKSTSAIAQRARNLNLPGRQITAANQHDGKETSWRTSFAVKSRKCLKCRNPFQSTGNFVCVPCSTVNRELSPMAEGFGL